MRRLVLAAAAVLAGCGAARPLPTAYHLPSLTAATRAGQPVGDLRCAARGRPATWVHVELFEDRRVVLLPSGIGIAPPRRTDGAYVRGGRCRYPLWTEEPTGLVAVDRAGLRLGDLFALWGRPLARDVDVHVNGALVSGPASAVALTPHAQIVVTTGLPVAHPHASYRFPPGH
jgi:hypothetical protein